MTSSFFILSRARASLVFISSSQGLGVEPRSKVFERGDFRDTFTVNRYSHGGASWQTFITSIFLTFILMPVSLAAQYTRVTKDNTEKHSDVFFKKSGRTRVFQFRRQPISCRSFSEVKSIFALALCRTQSQLLEDQISHVVWAIFWNRICQVSMTLSFPFPSHNSEKERETNRKLKRTDVVRYGSFHHLVDFVIYCDLHQLHISTSQQCRQICQRISVFYVFRLRNSLPSAVSTAASHWPRSVGSWPLTTDHWWTTSGTVVALL